MLMYRTKSGAETRQNDVTSAVVTISKSRVIKSSDYEAVVNVIHSTLEDL